MPLRHSPRLTAPPCDGACRCTRLDLDVQGNIDDATSTSTAASDEPHRDAPGSSETVNDAVCRILEENAKYNDDGTVSQHGWFKATFSTLNATAAANFVRDLLDGTRIAAPYPEDPDEFAREGCTHFAQWTWWNLTLADGSRQTFMLHFVESGDTTGRDGIDPNAFTRAALDRRNVSARLFDTFMYNSLVLQLESLDFIKGRLDEVRRA